jgi:hypothetical protein
LIVAARPGRFGASGLAGGRVWAFILVFIDPLIERQQRALAVVGGRARARKPGGTSAPEPGVTLARLYALCGPPI